MSNVSAVASARRPRIMLALAIVCFATVGAWLSQRIGVWSEEVSTYPSGPGRTLVDGPNGVPIVESCEGAVHLRESEHRPELALCAGDRTWPIMANSYISGWLYWPLATVLPSNVFVLRTIGIALGILTLLLCFRIARRMADPSMAAAGALATAFASPFVVAHALLVHFELLPLPLLLLASTWWVDGRSQGEIRPGRAAWVGLACGLAIAADVKALFLLTALVLYAWRTKRLTPMSGETRRILALCTALPLAPMMAFATADHRAGFSGQISQRIANVLERLTSMDVLLEPLNLLRYWTDVSAYGDQAAHLTEAVSLLPLLLPALALVRIATHAGRAALGRPHDALAAVQGALVCVYLVAGALLYTQQPAANYAPLHAVFGFATAGTAVAIGRAISSRFTLRPPVAATVSAVLVLAVVLGFAWNTLRRGDPARLPISTNAVAQRAVVAHLERGERGTVITATYNLAGVFESMSASGIEPVHIGAYVARTCSEGEQGRAEAARAEARQACRELRWHRAIDAIGAARLVLPIERALSDEAELDTILPTLRALEARGALSVELEGTFRGVDTRPLLALYRLRSTRLP